MSKTILRTGGGGGSLHKAALIAIFQLTADKM